MGLRALAIDLTPLRSSRDFRLLWFGHAISFTGSVITTVALPWEVFTLTHSSLAVGLLGLAELIPLLVLSIVGGAVADTVERRSLLLRLEIAMAACSLALARHPPLDPHVCPLYVLAAISSGLTGVHFAALRSMVPLLLPPEQRPAGFALTAAYGSFGMMFVPAVAGFLIAVAGLALTYTVDVASFAAAIVAVALIRRMPPMSEGRASRHSILEGLRFLRGQEALLAVFGIDLLAMVFGMPRALFPALAVRLGGGARSLGLLHASVAAGASLAPRWSGWTGRIRRHGFAVIASVVAWGIAVGAVGFAHTIWMAAVLLAAAGAADMVSGVFRSTMAADVTPDDLRGRVSGVEFAVYASGPLLGDVEAGVVASVTSLQFAIVSGGAVCVLGALGLARLLPKFVAYRSDAAEPLRLPATGS